MIKLMTRCSVQFVSSSATIVQQSSGDHAYTLKISGSGLV